MELSDKQKLALTQKLGFTKPHELDIAPDGLKLYAKPKLSAKDRILTTEALQIVERQSKFEHPKTTTYLGVPILQEHSIRVFARKVLMYMQFHQFVTMSNVGKSGAGKSTFTGDFIHELHTIAKIEFGIIFRIAWVGKKEIVNFDKWLQVQPHVNTIFIFEDISYALDRAKKDQKLT